MTNEKSSQPPENDSPLRTVEELKAKKGFGFFGKIRNYFLAGILITAPLSITVYLAYSFISLVDEQVGQLIPPEYNPESYLPFSIPGLGVILVVIVLTLIGALTAGFFGRMLVRVYESILNRTPIIRSLYAGLKQVLEAIFAQQSSAFREVVLLEYPKEDLWVLGFVTGRTKGQVQDLIEDEVLNIFVPTTPNPTSGFLIFVPKHKVKYLDIKIEDAFKMLISSGIVTPDSEDAKKKTTKNKKS